MKVSFAEIGRRRPLLWSCLAVAGLSGQPAVADSADLTVSCQHAPAVSDYDKAMLAELNRIRTDPVGFAADIRRYYAGMSSGRLFEHNGQRIQMTEGRPAVDEALAYLQRVSPLAPLDLATCLSAAAGEHAADQARHGGIGHQGSDGSDPSDRAGRYLSGKAYCGENIAYGDQSPFEVVMALAVDDGVPSRGHRQNLFNDTYRTVGFGHNRHPEYQGVDVMLLCMNKISNHSGHDYQAPATPVQEPVSSPVPVVTEPARPVIAPVKQVPVKPTPGEPSSDQGGSGGADSPATGATLLETTTETTEETYERDGVSGRIVTTVVTRRYSDGTEEEETTVETTEEWTEEVEE